MQIIQACGGFLLSLIVPLLFWGQAVPATIVDPPRQEMQTVAPNVPVGPYLMNITGKTFVNDVFLDVALTAKGQAVPDGTTVTFDAVPTKGGDATLVGAPPHVTAVTKAGHAKLVPLIAAGGDWAVTITVAGPAGNGTAAVAKMGVDTHSPPASLAYRLSQLAIPIVTVILLLAFFRVRHIDLERRPINRTQTHEGLAAGQG